VSVGLLEAVGADVFSTFALRYAGRLAARRGDHASRIAAVERALNLARGLGLPGLVNALTADLAEAREADGEL
jgi:hypothetical protein